MGHVERQNRESQWECPGRSWPARVLQGASHALGQLWERV